MKKILLSLFFISSSALAASPKAFKAVLEMAEVKSLASIETLHVKQTFRCPECYEICVQGLKSAADPSPVHFLVNTRYDQQKDEVVAEIVAPQK